MLEFYNEHKDDDAAALTHAVMTNEKMWGEDLTGIEGFEAAVVADLEKIRKEGVLKAYADCL